MKFHSKFLCTALAVCTSLLLGGCNSDDDDEQPPSVFEPSPAEGIWSAPAYGKIFEFSRSGNGYASTMFHVTSSSCLHGKVEGNLTAEDLAQITRLTDSEDQTEIRRAGAVLAPGVDYTRLSQLPDLCSDTQRLAVKGP